MIKPFLRAEIDPANPVQEICNVISAITVYHPGHELDLLRATKDAIEKRIKEVEASGEQIRESGRRK